ncbi:SulP family inorganic anion transporter [Variovorax sp. J2P1-59]|uniref:SulP family inorganic anion transporter n=1 Tax=Variovorax flavidus TaxID=3053501 RepID=UPI002578809E|nr:SulP family inorganic anion transporter [Variovorax sp. J2P1-59]MDM0077515.1 SulP family inorganic anion transporter [Variovorax sp. J2P1-59]
MLDSCVKALGVRPGAGLFWRPLPGDLRAAWVSALVMLPQGIAFAVLAGLPPEMGIYASVIPVIVASLLGPSGVLLSGPNTAVAMMLGIALLPLGVPGSVEYLLFAATLTAMIGMVQFAGAWCGVGRFLALLPRYAATGLNMGIGMLMLGSQIAPAMGLLSAPDLPTWALPWVYLQRWSDANPWALLVTLTSFVAGGLFARLRARWMPSLVAAMLFGAIAGGVLDLFVGAEAIRLERVGHLQLEWDVFHWPRFDADELYILKQLVLSAVGIAIVGSLQSVIILRSVAPDADHRACRRELLAQACSNLSASVSSGFACSGSFNRTSAHIEAGAVTRSAAVLSSLFLLLLAWIASPALAHLTHAAIAGTLALIGWRMVCAGWQSARRDSRLARLAAVGLGLCVPLAGIETTLLLAIVLVIVQLVLSQSRGHPH